ncbi:MAG: polyprenyl synthetase family protein [Planctomycetota bacterium]
MTEGTAGVLDSHPSAATLAAEVKSSLFGVIGSELGDVESLLKRELRSDYPYVDELVRYGCLLGGKRLRPALLLLVAKAVGDVQPTHRTLAAVVEMIHTATLVHDDVIDEADMRRHLATVNSRWDNEASVLLGDFLFTHAFYLASTMPTTLACRLIGQATNIVCEGELRQKGQRGNHATTEQEYLSIVEAKTAELCAVSCELGAHYAGATAEIAQQMSAYGRDLGIAFQIADDLLDFTGDEESTGKSLGTDLAKQRPTLPIIRLLQLASSTDRDLVLEVLRGSHEQPMAVLAPLLTRYAALDYTRQQASFFADRAERRLAGLSDSPALRALVKLSRFVVNRSY